MRCILIGNYGTGNFGDEALRNYFLTSFPDIEWQVVSARPQAGELPRLPAGIHSFFAMKWLRTLKELRHCDAVVFGGGTLFTDSESVFACFLWWLHVRIPCLLRKPVLFAFQGMGPFHSFIGAWFARDALKRARFLSVRDEASARRVEAWRLNSKVIQSFDPIYNEFINQKSDSIQNILNEKNALNIVLAVIPRGNATDDLYDRCREMLRSGTYTGMAIVSLRPDDDAEDAVSNKLEQDSPVPCQRLAVRSADGLIRALAPAAAVLSQRYHGSLAAIALGKKLILAPQAEGDKHAELRKYAEDEAARERLPELIRSGEIALREALFATSRSGGS